MHPTNLKATPPDIFILDDYRRVFLSIHASPINLIHMLSELAERDG